MSHRWTSPTRQWSLNRVVEGHAWPRKYADCRRTWRRYNACCGLLDWYRSRCGWIWWRDYRCRAKKWKNAKSLTGQYLAGKKYIQSSERRTEDRGRSFEGAAESNLRGIDVDAHLDDRGVTGYRVPSKELACQQRIEEPRVVLRVRRKNRKFKSISGWEPW